MKKPYVVLFAISFAFIFGACSSPKEAIRTEKPEIGKVEVTPPPAPRVFEYEDRYFVRGASIDLATKVDDPLQAIRVIQLKPGSNEVLVISKFSKERDRGPEVASETWFGIELPSMAPGSYDLSRASDVQFYRFFLGEKPHRLDGQKFSGSLNIESAKDGYLIGSINAVVDGVTKSFEQKSEPFSINFVGNFRIKEVPLDATIMKSGKK